MSHSKKQNELGRLAVHPFPARMAPAVALKAVSGKRRKLTVLDPMSGSGTVLAAARAKGHYAIDVDLDPLAVLLSKVWCTSVDRAPVQKKARKILPLAERNLQTTGNSYGALIYSHVLSQLTNTTSNIRAFADFDPDTIQILNFIFKSYIAVRVTKRRWKLYEPIKPCARHAE